MSLSSYQVPGLDTAEEIRSCLFSSGGDHFICLVLFFMCSDTLSSFARVWVTAAVSEVFSLLHTRGDESKDEVVAASVVKLNNL